MKTLSAAPPPGSDGPGGSPVQGNSRQRKRGGVMKILLQRAALAAAVLSLTAGSAAGGENASLSLSSAAGGAGERVEVAVEIRAGPARGTMAGISGGELTLVYDPHRAEVIAVAPGEALGGFLFVCNPRLAAGSVGVSWASGTGLITEGVICRAAFLLKREGPFRPLLTGISLYDQQARPLTVTAVHEEGPGEASARYSIGPPDMIALPGPVDHSGTAGGPAGEPGDAAVPGADPGEPAEGAGGGIAPWILPLGAALLLLAGWLASAKLRRTGQR